MGKASRRKEEQPKKVVPISPTTPPQPKPWFSTYGWIIPLLLVLLVNANVLLNGFAWDDRIFFVEQSYQTQQPVAPGLTPGAYYRPLIEWSYRLDRWLWNLNPFGFHLSVYLAHALTTLMVFMTVNLLARIYQKPPWIALLTASLFAVHPIHVEAVAWIAGRNDVFMTLFVLLALYAYLRYRHISASWSSLSLFTLGCMLGLLSKETAVPFLWIFPILNFLFHRSRITSLQFLRDPLMGVWVLVFGLFVIYRLTRVEMPPLQEGGVVSFGNGLMTVLTALGYYLKLLFIPYPLNLFVDKLPLKGIQGGLYLLIGSIGLILLTWILLRGSKNLFAIGAAWFLLGIAAPLTVPLTNVSATPVAERYAYLASAGFLLVVCMGALEGWRRLRVHMHWNLSDRWMTALVTIIIGLFSFLTVERNAVWRSEVTLWEDTIKRSPDAIMPHYNLGLAYYDKGALGAAIKEFQQALTLKPHDAAARNNLGVVYQAQGRLDEAAQEYQKALGFKPDHATAHNNLGMVYFQYGRVEEALKEIRIALELRNDLPVAHYNLAVVYETQGQIEEAAQEYQEALRHNPHLFQAYNNLGILYQNQGRFEEAIQQYKTGLRQRPTAELFYNLGNAYSANGRLEEAIREYQAALRLQPNLAEVHYNLGLAYRSKGMPQQARDEFEQALKINPGLIPARQALESLSK